MIQRLLLDVVLLQTFLAVAFCNMAFIEVGDIEWESLAENELGERRFKCRNFEQSFQGRYQWRFNGSSVLPSSIKIAGKQLIFLNGSNAKRRQLVGAYDCCVKENIGDGCYRTHLKLKDSLQTIGLNIENSSEVVTVEGNSYFLRLFPVKKLNSIVCSHNGNSTLPENIIFNTKSAHHQKKFHNFYQLKVDDIDKSNAGKYTCETSVFGSGTLRKTFIVVVEKEKRTASINLQQNHKSISHSTRPGLASLLISLVFYSCINVVVD
uniref:Ig-like domain-containing protein n=2 Tax=Parascaris univalens TaxID=6257 RepID=A0A915AP21_PARUN